MRSSRVWSRNPRSQLLSALLLDGVGQLLLLAPILMVPILPDLPPGLERLEGQGWWLFYCLMLYPLLGWLFGSYTVLRWRQLSLAVLLQRLLITSVAMLIVVAVSRWLLNPGDLIWLVHRRFQLVWLAALTLWSFLVRVALRRGLLLQDAPRLLLLASERERDALLAAWQRVPQRQCLEPVTPDQLQRCLLAGDALVVGVSPAIRRDPALGIDLDQLEERDPRLVQVLSVASLFEQQQERLPPAWLDELGIDYDGLPWMATFSVQRQLKRIADLLLAGVLLLLTLPIVALAALLIWLEDRGSVVYAQQRSGWLGQPFTVFKLRTMREQSPGAPAQWTQPGDRRITWVGRWLRRVRLDELPQLLNVLSGDMSLIGPRPERPELEHELERSIPHYRKRHWMRPGLSGWAQVCAPYASSIEDSDLKLSYDLYYLRHFSTWLDLVILFRTIKTILKAGGR